MTMIQALFRARWLPPPTRAAADAPRDSLWLVPLTPLALLHYIVCHTRPNIFQKIVQRKIKTDFLYEDDQVLVFRDIAPLADTHLLVVPKEYIHSWPMLSPSNADSGTNRAREGPVTKSNTNKESNHLELIRHMKLVGIAVMKEQG